MQIHVLEVTFNFNGKEETIYPVILRDSFHTILVDCGYPGFIPLIENAAKCKGLSLADVTAIIITHHDIDHIGSLAEIVDKYPAVKVYSFSLERNYITGKEKSLRLKQAEDLYETLPEERKAGAFAFQEMLKDLRPIHVVYTISEEHPPFEGVEIIHTPGHMPGHISLYLPGSKTLIAADALVIENDELEIANPAFTLDLPAAIDSVKKLSALDINTIICYHGGIISKNIQSKFQNLISKYDGAF